MRIGVDVGGTNTDAVLLSGAEVVAGAKQTTTADVSTGVSQAISAVLADSGVARDQISSVTIGTTHFINALVERNRLDEVAIFRLASPSGEALPPFTAWPRELARKVGRRTFLLPGGYEVDGREIAPLDERKIRDAARTCREEGINAIAVSSVFAPLNATMENEAARIIREAHPQANVSLSNQIGRIGLIERENGVILNAALTSLAGHVMSSFATAIEGLGLSCPLYISQNDGTMISDAFAERYPVMTIGSGPTNSMRGAAFLTGVKDAIVMDVGGTTCDVGVLANGFPRESSLTTSIGGVRTNFRMPDVLAIALGGGTRIHLDGADGIRVGPQSVGYRLTEDAYIFGGRTLTASDIAVAAGKADFGDRQRLPALDRETIGSVWSTFRAMLEDGIDSMKTASGDVPIIAVGGANFLIDPDLRGALPPLLRPPHAPLANAIGAGMGEVGGVVEGVVDYDATPREAVLQQYKDRVRAKVAAAGGAPDTIRIVDVDEVFLSYLPGRAAQLRVKAVGQLAETGTPSAGRMKGRRRAT